jgi:hypothetical protein
MLLSIISSIALMTMLQTSSNSVDAICRPGKANHLLNIPQTNPASKTTEIVHGAAVTSGGDVIVGYLYLLRNGKIWYQNGLIGNTTPLGLQTATSAVSKAALGAIGAMRVQAGRGSLLPLSMPNPERSLWLRGYSIVSCF